MKKFYEIPTAELCRIKMAEIMLLASEDSDLDDEPVVTDREYSKLY